MHKKKTSELLSLFFSQDCSLISDCYRYVNNQKLNLVFPVRKKNTVK